MHEMVVGDTVVYFEFVDGEGDLPAGVSASVDPSLEDKAFVIGQTAYAVHAAVHQALLDYARQVRFVKERERAIEDASLMFGNRPSFKPTRTGVFAWLFGQ